MDKCNSVKPRPPNLGLRGTLFHTLFSFKHTHARFLLFFLLVSSFILFCPFLLQGKCRLPTTRNYWRFPTDSPTHLLPSSLFKIEIVLLLKRVFSLSTCIWWRQSILDTKISIVTLWKKKRWGEKGKHTYMHTHARTHTHTATNLNTTQWTHGGKMHVYAASKTRLEGENAIKYSLLLSLFSCSLSLCTVLFLRHLYTKVSFCIGVL